LAPSSDGGDDFVGLGKSLEVYGVGIAIVEEAVDGRLEVDDGSKGAASERRLVRIAKKPRTALGRQAAVGAK
jgi:hypothetical protein